MAGTIVADDIQHSTAGSVGTEYVVNGSVKVWVQYDTTPSTVVRDSFNVASTTDVSAGYLRPNFSSNMANTGYAPHVTGQINYVGFINENYQTTSSTGTTVSYVNWSAADQNHHSVSLVGDLA